MMRRSALVFVLCFVGVARAQAPDELALQLRSLKRVYVDKFGGGEGAAQIRDMLIASLQGAKLFVITENPERADAVLRGSGEDLVFTDLFQTSEGINARTNVGVGKGSSSKSRDYLNLGGGVGDNEQSRIQERKHEASASVRIVNKDGDVIWSTTQESQGAKFRSASADVADKITRQLVLEFGRGLGQPAGVRPVPGIAPAGSAVSPPSK
ncbi:MAG: hypothetical protein QM757_16005 [Paludibaculum sp.]